MIALQLACLAFVLVHIIRYAEPIKTFFKLKRLKPFDCETCTAFHLGWTYFYFIENQTILTAILQGSLTCVIVIYLTRYAK